MHFRKALKLHRIFHIEKNREKSPKNFNSSPVASIFLLFRLKPALGHKQNLCFRFLIPFNFDPFWDNFNSNFPQIAKIANFGQKLAQKRVKIEKYQKSKTSSVCTQKPQFYAEKQDNWSIWWGVEIPRSTFFMPLSIWEILHNLSAPRKYPKWPRPQKFTRWDSRGDWAHFRSRKSRAITYVDIRENCSFSP